MELARSLLHSQEPATYPYPDPALLSSSSIMSYQLSVQVWRLLKCFLTR